MRYLSHSLRVLLGAGVLALTTPAFGRAAPPVGSYPVSSYSSPASSYFPGYRPSVSYSYSGPRPNYYSGFVPYPGYSQAYDPGFARSYGRIAPTTPQAAGTPTRFYVPSGEAEENAPAESTAQIKVHVPANATVWFDGWKASSTGAVRTFQSTPLIRGRRYVYTVRARWEENGREVTQTQQVPVSAGARIQITFPIASGAEGKPETSKNR